MLPAAQLDLHLEQLARLNLKYIFLGSLQLINSATSALVNASPHPNNKTFFIESMGFAVVGDGGIANVHIVHDFPVKALNCLPRLNHYKALYTTAPQKEDTHACDLPSNPVAPAFPLWTPHHHLQKRTASVVRIVNGSFQRKHFPSSTPQKTFILSLRTPKEAKRTLILVRPQNPSALHTSTSPARVYSSTLTPLKGTPVLLKAAT